MPQRDENGRFVKGNSGGPGRPMKAREERYYEILVSTISFEDWKKIVMKARDQALRGDSVARTWLGNYIIGVPDQNFSGDVRIVFEYVGDSDDDSDSE